MREAPSVSIVIPTRNRPEKLYRCVESLTKCEYPRFTITVVDDCSGYDVREKICGEFPRVKVVRNDVRRLLAYSRNRGARESSGDYIFFIDDDNVVDEHVLAELVKFLEAHRNFAVCSPVVYLLDDPGKTWTTYTVKGNFPAYNRLEHDVPKEPTLTWAFHDAFMVRRSFFEALGGFDEKGFPIHFSEYDFTYTIHENGYRAAVIPSAKIWLDHGGVHMHVDSSRAFYTLRNRIILVKKHEGRKSLAAYACALPFLIVYYLIHHARGASDNPLRASFNLLAGVLAGFEYRVPPRAVRRAPVRQG